MKKLDVELNKTYDYFDDGKISESRRTPVTITEIIPYSKIDKETLSLWKEEVKDCHWLYAEETDYFIKGNLKFDNDKVESIIFVRTVKDNGWFSLGFWGGRLDLDGSLANMLNSY